MIQGSIGGFKFLVCRHSRRFFMGYVNDSFIFITYRKHSNLGARRSDSILQGQTLDAVIVLTVGILVIGIIDNFLRPRLIGKDSKMSDYLGLVSTLGGLSWFSLTGFVLGPIIAALFITCWDIMGQESQASKRKQSQKL